MRIYAKCLPSELEKFGYKRENIDGKYWVKRVMGHNVVACEMIDEKCSLIFIEKIKKGRDIGGYKQLLFIQDLLISGLIEMVDRNYKKSDWD